MNEAFLDELEEMLISTDIGVTTTIYLASISVLLISSCYWKGANSWGAFGSIIFAAAIPVAFLVLEKTPAKVSPISKKCYSDWENGKNSSLSL